MYEMLDIDNGSRLLNIDINRELYTDESIGEYPPVMETVIFENEMYRISFSPINNKEIIVCYKIYKKDSINYHVCRINAFEDAYINSRKNTFKLDKFDLYLFNQIISSYELMTNAIENYNLTMEQILSNGDFDNIKEIWKQLSFDILKQPYLLSL